MKLVLLGTAGYHPSDRRHTAALMLPEAGIVLDAGTGVYRAREFLRTASLDFFITHAHLDHVVGLTYLLGLVRDKPLERITVHAATDTLAAIQDHLLATSLFPARLPCEFRPLEPETPLADGGRLTHFALEHPGGALGFRLDWPQRSLAYVTDTTARPDAAYLEAVRGVDVLVHEANFPDSQRALAERTGHSVVGAVAELALRAGVGRLVLVHVDPLVDEAAFDLAAVRSVFRSTVLGRDLLAIDF